MKTWRSALAVIGLPMPDGLRMIAGDASRPGESDGSPTGFSCEGGSGPALRGQSIQNCPLGTELWMGIQFPQCWDGVNLDSPDHKSHMAYPTPGVGCPPSHPVPIPEIAFNIRYEIPEANAPLHWRLSSDTYDASIPGDYSAHGDWVNGWQEEVKNMFIRNCDQPSTDCHSHLLGEGKMIY